MTAAALGVPRLPPAPSPPDWAKLYGPPAGWDGGLSKNAVYYNGNTYFGFIDDNGGIHVAAYNHASHTVTVSPVIVTPTPRSGYVANDIHATPSVLVRSSDHKLLLAVAAHLGSHMYVAVSTNAEDVSAWGAATDIASTLGATTYTYSNLFQLSGEAGKIYLFYRDQIADGSNVLSFSTSTDGGSAWAAQTHLYENATKHSYWVVDSDSANRIDFAVDDGSAADGDTASLYHFYYSGGSYYKSDGTLISAGLPLAPASLTKLYDGATNGNVRVPYAIFGNSGSPYVVWAAYDTAGAGSNEHYWYGHYSSGWTTHQIADSGSTPSADFSEGGVAIDRLSPSDLYLSRLTGGQWQIVHYTTSDGGTTWTSAAVTADSDQPNLRPIAPRNGISSLRILWCYGPHYVYSSSEPSPAQIRGYPNPKSVF